MTEALAVKKGIKPEAGKDLKTALNTVETTLANIYTNGIPMKPKNL